MITLNTPLKKAIHTTKAHLGALELMNIKNVLDLLLFFPRTYEIHNQSNSVSDFRLDQINTIEAKVIDMSSHMGKRSNKWFYKALLVDADNREFEAVWFAKPYQLAHAHFPLRKKFIGKVKHDFGKFTLQSPKIEATSENTLSRKIFPVYPQTEKISSSYLLSKIQELLYLIKDIPENLSQELLKEEGLISKAQAVKNIHFPESEELLEKSRERLAYEELFQVQMDALMRKKEYQEKSETFDISIPINIELVKSFFKTLPFTPTNAQKISIFEILKDMEKEVPMSRLLEGDVGSGKTLVAATVALCAINAGYQVAIMAPTEVLARQHYEKFYEFFKGEHKVGLLLGSQKKAEKNETLLGLLGGDVLLVVGTHALIQESVTFHNLGLAIIDEQHRFGVEQRKKLSVHGKPHVLSMTATPIPRTLALVAYGDQDLSVLNEMPPGRQEIITRVVKASARLEVTRFVDTEFEKGRQAYVICPLIQESKSEIMADVKSVTEEYERLKVLFPHRKIAMLHGKLKSEEKNEIMTSFKNKCFDMLVSTSVIEVGVDVPNATIMIIEGAERFGLSQLHQFRGRVGRGKDQSYCFLFPSKESLQDNERLQSMEKFSDGFKLAEIDMRLRGPGEVYGVRQSGIPDLKMATLTDQKFVHRVRLAAEKFLEKTSP
ncbi:ATP-dependent DNA helicase RecG [Candidatus Peregrinibacteria bacterium]|jgi:ATP-dependent DNA helicase RecG|nr:ATP-dependent DNA helicase RecG [Candidatus Peregrinibacteria bacterium]